MSGSKFIVTQNTAFFLVLIIEKSILEHTRCWSPQSKRPQLCEHVMPNPSKYELGTNSLI